jgi:HSP20 family protein
MNETDKQKTKEVFKMTYLVPSTNRITREMDSLFNNFFNFPSFRTDDSSDFMPRVNIKDTKDNVILAFELPGMEKKDIRVTVKDEVLTISGQRDFRTEEKNEGWVRTEISSGSFSRSFTLPDTVDTEKVNADYKNGMLEVKLAKRPERKPKEIEVNIG